MYYVNKDAINGNHGNPTTEAIGDCYILPDELIDGYISTLGFALLTIADDGVTVTAVAENKTALDDYLLNHPAPPMREQRENAYNTDPVIEWQGRSITVTEAAALWQYYSAEGDAETAESLTALIVAAKAEIRAKFPDEEGKV